jgi:DUF971 family protein
MVPQDIENDMTRMRLTLCWPDGRRQVLTHATLRLACRCAFCRATPPAVSPDIRVLELQAVGYGVQPIFSDGHDRGIFPWAYLAALSPHLPSHKAAACA